MPQPILAIAGPTASGKTGAALALAEIAPIEIISVDSALVYRGMDIGTAKPNPQELAAVRHHLIDTHDPLDSYNAADFMREVEPLIADVQARGHQPVLVGGTMLYFKAWLDGLDDMPSADLNVRAAIDAQAAQIGWPAMHQILAKDDPITAARLNPNDAQRISRALEVLQSTGQPLSAFQRGQGQSQWHRVHMVSLEPNNRSWLHERIGDRFASMLKQGFAGELDRLMARGDLHLGLPSMRCVGYRQGWEALEMHGGQWNEAVAAHWLERGCAATRQLAKRQLTWLRSMPERQVVPAESEDVVQQVQAIARRLWGH